MSAQADTIKKILKDTTPQQQVMLVSIVLDETGSMQACKDATISGFNEYLTTLRQIVGDVRVTLTKFNSEKTEVVYAGQPLLHVRDLTDRSYQPVANTPLYDAIAAAIKATQQARKSHPDSAVLFVIQTDGQENSSKQYDQEQIVKLIKAREKDGWTFVYLGANQDAWKVGQSLGMARANTMSYTHTTTDAAFKSLRSATLCYASQHTSGQLQVGKASTKFFGDDTLTLKDPDEILS